MLNENHNYDVSFLDRMGPKEAFDHFNDVEKKDVIKRLFDWHGEWSF